MGDVIPTRGRECNEDASWIVPADGVITRPREEATSLSMKLIVDPVSMRVLNT